MLQALIVLLICTMSFKMITCMSTNALLRISILLVGQTYLILNTLKLALLAASLSINAHSKGKLQISITASQKTTGPPSEKS